MKELFALIMILPAIMLAACASQEMQSTSSANVPGAAQETPAPVCIPYGTDGPERMIYNSRDEFINEVNKAKEVYEKTGDKTYHRIEEIDWYYDFKDAVKDVELDGVYVTYAYVALDYPDIEAKETDSATLLLECTRPSGVDLNDLANEEKRLENIRDNYGYGHFIDIIINGHKALKEEVYWDDEKTGSKEHICNQYYWVENGTAIFLRIPPWLLERYPEGTFFDIEKVEIKKPDEAK